MTRNNVITASNLDGVNDMNIYYKNNEIIKIIFAKDLFSEDTSTMNNPSIMDIDELDPENKALCIDLKRTEWKFNEQGQRKYYISGGQLYSRDGWVEYNPQPTNIWHQ